MKHAARLLAGLVVTGCTLPGLGPTAGSPDRTAEFVLRVEQAGCRLDPDNHDAVLHSAGGFTDADAGAIGAALVADGRGEVTDTGDLILLTENCL